MNSLPSIPARWRGALVSAGLACVLGLAALWIPQFDFFTNLSYDLGFPFRPVLHPKDAVIVYMDEKSHDVLEQPWGDRWNRAVHARLIDRLTQLGSKAIVFDVLFEVKSNNLAADHRLVEAARASGKVIVASKLTHRIIGENITYQLTHPFNALSDVTKSGVIEESGADKMIRTHNYDAARKEPSIAWRAADMLGVAPDPSRERWVNYYGPPGTVENLSYYMVFQNSPTLAETISNKVVFVGAKYDVGFTGGKGTDDFRNPCSLWKGLKSPGVEINATTFLNLKRGDSLSRLPPIWETLLIILTAVGSAFAAALVRPVNSVLAGLAAMVFVPALCILVEWQTLTFVPWMIVAGVQIPVAVLCSVLGQTRALQREKKSLEQMVAILSQGNMRPPEDIEEQPAYKKIQERLQPSPVTGRKAEPTASQGSFMPSIPDYELVRCIGKGGYGEVWLAKTVLGGYQAVKILERNNFKDARPLEREFNGLKKFTPISRAHPNFIHILHVGRHEDPDYIFYVMELADDEAGLPMHDPAKYSPRTLASDMRKRKRFTLLECLEIAIPLANALDYLHKANLIHRDIKPANILFAKGSPKLADVGLVTEMDLAGSSVTYVGTPGRIAPEGPGSPAGDVFSFGKLLYEIGIGLPLDRFPELPTSLVDSKDDGAMQLNLIILKACEMDIRKRYQTAFEILTDLVDLRTRLLSLAPPAVAGCDAAE